MGKAPTTMNERKMMEELKGQHRNAKIGKNVVMSGKMAIISKGIKSK